MQFMLRTFFSALGVALSALLLFCGSFLANVAIGIDRNSGTYEAMAVDITRELAHNWKLSAIETHYADEARRELSPVLDADLHSLKLLGPLLHVDDVKVEPRWTLSSERRPYAPGLLADRLAALINRSVKVTFTGKFAGGLASVSAELKREDGALKLWRLRIESSSSPSPPERPERRVISHA
jgi:hypothetical protein